MSQEMMKQLNAIKGRRNTIKAVADRLGYALSTVYMWQCDPGRAGRKAREAVNALYVELFEDGMLGKELTPRKTVLAVLRAKFGQGCVGYPQDEIEAPRVSAAGNSGIMGVT
jgi:hypothetical protein